MRLFLAIKNGSLTDAPATIEECKEPDSVVGTAALHTAILFKQKKMVELLLAKYPELWLDTFAPEPGQEARLNMLSVAYFHGWNSPEKNKPEAIAILERLRRSADDASDRAAYDAAEWWHKRNHQLMVKRRVPTTKLHPYPKYEPREPPAADSSDAKNDAGADDAPNSMPVAAMGKKRARG